MIIKPMEEFRLEDPVIRPPLTEAEISRRRAATTSGLCHLPLFNQGAIKLLSIVSDDDQATADFEAVFRSDPGLAAELLLVANSAEFGFQARISSIRHALSVLGLERTRSLAARIAMSFYLRTSSREEVRAVWSHSIASAVLAEHIAAANALPTPGLYTAALLHDIGSLGLLLTSTSQYPELVALKLVDLQEANSIDTMFWGLSHMDAGILLADTWGFPTSLRRCISGHHGHVSASDDPVLNVVQLACRLAGCLGYPEVFLGADEKPEGPTAVLAEALPRRPEFTAERLQELISKQMAP
jgi:HD-like signal output (HDOD) protein